MPSRRQGCAVPKGKTPLLSWAFARRLGPVLWILVEPQDEAGDGHHAPVMSGEFFVAGGESAEAFEVAEAAFDDVTPPVDLFIEATAAPSAPCSGRELVRSFGDGVRDVA
jgi:hypothetical protein